MKHLPSLCLLLLLSGCMPISQNPTPQPLCHEYFTSIPVNQSAPDPISPDLPGHIDITGVESRLDGQTLTATFHLKHMPELMDVRYDKTDTTVNYLYTVSINPDGTKIYRDGLSEYMMAAYHLPETSDSAPEASELRLRTVLWKNKTDQDTIITNYERMPNNINLQISHQDNTLTMTADIPDISENATVLFVAEDLLAGSDGNSCEPIPGS